ncbi:MAG: outer membrane lipoprotein carrier protein LolA [Myxococcota bacterium]
MARPLRSARAPRTTRSGALAAAFAALALAAALAAPAAAAAPAAPAASPAGTPVAAPPTLAALLAGFRTLPGFEARFEEEKTLALLAAPLSTRGRLYFDPPSTLLRRVEAPNPHDILIRDHVVRISTPKDVGSPESAAAEAAGERTVETIDLTHRDEVRPLVESMLWIFSGDLAQLESVYTIDYRVTAPAASGRWQLRLAPRAAPLSHLIRSLSISGRGHGADRLEVEEISGDRTTTRILEADSQRRFAPGEIERLFESAGS